MFDSISVYELKKNSLVNLIDIRSVEKYNSSHILNAKNIPANNLIASMNKYLNKDDKYYIYCQRGILSKKVCQILKSNGYDVINIIGGYEAWLLSE